MNVDKLSEDRHSRQIVIGEQVERFPHNGIGISRMRWVGRLACYSEAVRSARYKMYESPSRAVV